MFKPKQFQVHEAWIAFKLNDAPMTTEANGDFNVLALMDTASCFILGSECIRAVSSEPSQAESRRLLIEGQSRSQQHLPKKLFVPKEQAADILCAEAERLGITVIRAPEEDLALFIREAREGFQEHVGGGSFH